MAPEKFLLKLGAGTSFDQYGEQSGYRQTTREFPHGNRRRSRLKRLARNARQRNRRN